VMLLLLIRFAGEKFGIFDYLSWRTRIFYTSSLIVIMTSSIKHTSTWCFSDWAQTRAQMLFRGNFPLRAIVSSDFGKILLCEEPRANRMGKRVIWQCVRIWRRYNLVARRYILMREICWGGFSGGRSASEIKSDTEMNPMRAVRRTAVPPLSIPWLQLSCLWT
jgi:hypothetical protein